MDYLNKRIVLNSQASIPMLGLGTWKTPDRISSSIVSFALKNGYVHIDTANAYENEAGVGAGIRASGIKRESLFVTSKIPAEIKSYSGAKSKIDESLSLLGLDYIDLMLIHCPKPWDLFMDPNAPSFDKENVMVYQALEEAMQDGKLKAIGVSNFGVGDLKNIMDNCRVKPAVNQICFHVGYTLPEIFSFCQTSGIVVEGYSPIGTGHLLHDPVIVEIANRYGVSSARICIAYSLQKGLVTIPKSVHEEYVLDNARIDFVLSDKDMMVLDGFSYDAYMS